MNGSLKLITLSVIVRKRENTLSLFMITDEELNEIEFRCAQTQNGPWKAYIENRDHESGGNFIMTGNGESRGEDIEMSGATVADFDFIASAKQDIPRLINEIRLLKNK